MTTQQKNDLTDKRINIPKRKVISFLIICVVLILLICVGINYLIYTTHTTELKRQASSVELAIIVTVRENDIYGINTYDNATQSGLTLEAYAKIIELSGLDGEIYVTNWEQQTLLPNEMHIDGHKGFSAYYQRESTSEHGKWEIVKNGSYRLF